MLIEWIGSLVLIVLETLCVRPSMVFSWYWHVVTIVCIRWTFLHMSIIRLGDVIAWHRGIFVNLSIQILTHIAIRLQVPYILETVNFRLYLTSQQLIIRYAHWWTIAFLIVFGTSTSILEDWNSFQWTFAAPFLLWSHYATDLMRALFLFILFVREGHHIEVLVI